MNERFEQRLSAIEYELSQIAESEYLEELKEKFSGDYGKDVVVNIITSRDISFKTRSLLSSILDRLELNHQDRLDLEKYIIYGGGDNIEYLKQTLAVWVEWKDKVLNIIQNAPEEFDSLIEIFNYIEEHIKDATNVINNKADKSELINRRQSYNYIDKETARRNIDAQEILVSGVNIATINGESILEGRNINLGKIKYVISLGDIGSIEGTTVTYTGKWSNSGSYDSDMIKEFKELCEGNCDIVYSDGIGVDFYTNKRIIPSLYLVYSGTSMPNYIDDEIVSYYSCKDWLLTCRAIAKDSNVLFESETTIKITLEKLI